MNYKRHIASNVFLHLLTSGMYAFIFFRARYGVQLESGPFQRRTADFLWMMIFGALSLLVCFYLGIMLIENYCIPGIEILIREN